MAKTSKKPASRGGFAGEGTGSGRVKGKQSYDAWTRETESTRRVKLTDATLRRIYERSSTIRPVVQQLALTISGLPYKIRTVDGRTERKKDIEFVEDFLINPNPNKEDFRQILYKIIVDLLVLDRSVIEKVRSLSGDVLEIFVRDPSTFSIIVDADGSGIIEAYRQRVVGNDNIDFTPEEIIYVNFSPVSNDYYGTPIIETISNEMAACIFAIQHIGYTFDKDEIPPGILTLGDMDDPNYNRFKNSINSKNKDFMLHVLRGVESGEVSWIPLKRPNRDMEIISLHDIVQKIVWRNFGVTPTSMGQTDDVNKAVAETQIRLEQSRLIKPIVQRLKYVLDTELIYAITGNRDTEIQFFLPEVDSFNEVATGVKTLQSMGALTINEVRNMVAPRIVTEGMLPAVENGDEHLIILGNTVVRVRDLSELSSIVDKNKNEGDNGGSDEG